MASRSCGTCISRSIDGVTAIQQHRRILDHSNYEGENEYSAESHSVCFQIYTIFNIKPEILHSGCCIYDAPLRSGVNSRYPGHRRRGETMDAMHRDKTPSGLVFVLLYPS